MAINVAGCVSSPMNGYAGLGFTLVSVDGLPLIQVAVASLVTNVSSVRMAEMG
jgi:hypothetical protein